METVIYNDTIIPHLAAHAGTEYNLIIDEDGLVSSELKLLPVPAPKPVLAKIKSSNQNFMSENTGAVDYVAISELVIPPAVGTKYAVDIMIYLQDLEGGNHPLALQVHSNAEWESSLFGHTYPFVAPDNSLLVFLEQHLEEEGSYVMADSAVQRSAIRVEGFLTTNEVTEQSLEVYMKHLTVGEGSVPITVLEGSWMKLTPVEMIT